MLGAMFLPIFAAIWNIVFGSSKPKKIFPLSEKVNFGHGDVDTGKHIGTIIFQNGGHVIEEGYQHEGVDWINMPRDTIVELATYCVLEYQIKEHHRGMIESVGSGLLWFIFIELGVIQWHDDDMWYIDMDGYYEVGGIDHVVVLDAIKMLVDRSNSNWR
jgi:hypothetical protein